MAPSQPSQIEGAAQTGLGIHIYEVTLQNEVNFRWEISVGGIIHQGQGTNRVLVSWQSESNFELKVTPQNECNDSTARVLGVNVNVITSLLEKEISRGKVYPNPSTGVIFVGFDGSSNWESLILINSINQRIQSVDRSENQDKIRLENLQKGLYILQIQSKSSTAQYKFIVN